MEKNTSWPFLEKFLTGADEDRPLSLDKQFPSPNASALDYFSNEAFFGILSRAISSSLIDLVQPITAVVTFGGGVHCNRCSVP